MKVICLDDEKIILQGMVMNCKKVEKITEVVGFSNAKDLMEYLKDNTADLIFSDINMPNMNGIEISKWLRENHPEINVVFTTGYTEYTNEAIRANAKGYLLKPISREMIEEEINYFLSNNELNKRIVVQAFGNFDIKVDGNPLKLSAKSKEALAYLIDRNGAAVSRKELAATIFEDDTYSRTIQSYITKISTGTIIILGFHHHLINIVRNYFPVTTILDYVFSFIIIGIFIPLIYISEKYFPLIIGKYRVKSS